MGLYVLSTKFLKSERRLVKCILSFFCFSSIRYHVAFKELGWYGRLKVRSSYQKSFPWQKKEQIALVQFVALFDDLKKDGSEWPKFGNRHDYWNKAAAFVQETTGTEFRRSG